MSVTPPPCSKSAPPSLWSSAESLKKNPTLQQPSLFNSHLFLTPSASLFSSQQTSRSEPCLLCPSLKQPKHLSFHPPRTAEGEFQGSNTKNRSEQDRLAGFSQLAGEPHFQCGDSNEHHSAPIARGREQSGWRGQNITGGGG